MKKKVKIIVARIEQIPIVFVWNPNINIIFIHRYFNTIVRYYFPTRNYKEKQAKKIISSSKHVISFFPNENPMLSNATRKESAGSSSRSRIYMNGACFHSWNCATAEKQLHV